MASLFGCFHGSHLYQREVIFIKIRISSTSASESLSLPIVRHGPFTAGGRGRHWARPDPPGLARAGRPAGTGGAAEAARREGAGGWGVRGRSSRRGPGAEEGLRQAGDWPPDARPQAAGACRARAPPLRPLGPGWYDPAAALRGRAGPRRSCRGERPPRHARAVVRSPSRAPAGSVLVPPPRRAQWWRPSRVPLPVAVPEGGR